PEIISTRLSTVVALRKLHAVLDTRDAASGNREAVDEPPKEIDRLSRFFWFPPFSIPLCSPRSNKRPCSRESNSMPNKYRG
ncbi:hypothetical protein ALC57_10212, partial [Trachymyrmex cornetzi]